MKRACLFFAWLILAYTVHGQHAAEKYKKLYFYHWGLKAYSDDPDNCIQSVQNAFGFGHKTKAGCVVSDAQVRRWRRHNKRVEKKLISRFGNDWEERYKTACAKCAEK